MPGEEVVFDLLRVGLSEILADSGVKAPLKAPANALSHDALLVIFFRCTRRSAKNNRN